MSLAQTRWEATGSLGQQQVWSYTQDPVTPGQVAPTFGSAVGQAAVTTAVTAFETATGVPANLRLTVPLGVVGPVVPCPL